LCTDRKYILEKRAIFATVNYCVKLLLEAECCLLESQRENVDSEIYYWHGINNCCNDYF